MQVYARMSEVLGITDDNHVLETFMTKIVNTSPFLASVTVTVSVTSDAEQPSTQPSLVF
ncbi:unnamed protein product [Rangifer tarandus platyrhynchus]|uniref:Uncharacterized protein n=1 Tax=Rangifer tarandus platyrhynchus TaxID=3082113 RepID=A0AC59YEP2_RANTA